MKNPPPIASLYASEAKIYARRAKGRYARLRVVAMLALLSIFYATPWLQWGGHPLVLFDLPARRFHLFGLTLFPQDLFLLAALLVCAALTLFFFTTLGGRLWCGYACPQTVWTQAFMWMERITEGDRHQRQKLDHGNWSGEKLARKAAKHALWFSFAMFTGLSFVSYFIPARQMFGAAFTLSLAGWPLFWALFYGFATWGNAGFMREQVCKYMCPYARFQSAMFDKDTLIIAYDNKRGEPRKAAAKLAGLPAGDCVDCSLCVQVCPVGIDIRKGLQSECIACAACVDVCNEVMVKVGKPAGLVRYTTEHRDEGGSLRMLRPRAIGYGLVWMAMLIAFATLVLTRSQVGLDVLRDRRQLYRELDDGSIANVFTLKIANKADAAHEFSIRATDAAGAQVKLSSVQARIEASSTDSVVVAAIMPADKAHGVQTLTFEVRADDDPALSTRHDARFIGASK
ncbi:cytochrome c oxidase accessory protein CcoG [Hydrocarboniphaga sp.]|uniref:cytochrome c oxidase accessory protein CcoG n=1 Tax=Hydrocarboniphaga sp. TaxID=2033016 RepID=UPI003D0B1C33